MRIYLTIILALSIVRFAVTMAKSVSSTDKGASLFTIATDIVGIIFVWII